MKPSEPLGPDASAMLAKALGHLKSTFTKKVELRAIQFREALERQKALKAEHTAALGAPGDRVIPQSNISERLNRPGGGSIVWDRSATTTVIPRRVVETYRRDASNPIPSGPAVPSAPPSPQPLLIRTMTYVADRLGLRRFFSR